MITILGFKFVSSRLQNRNTPKGSVIPWFAREILVDRPPVEMINFIFNENIIVEI